MKKNPSLIISAGKGCFTCCKGCYQFFGDNLVPTEDLLKFVKKYQKKFNLKKVTLAGGDPLTRSDIVYLIDELSKMNLHISIDTVGKNFVESSNIIFHGHGKANYINPEKISDKITSLGIALDGHTTEQINYFRRGIKLSEIEKILSVLNNYDYNVCINTVVHRYNINDLYKIYMIISKYACVKKWQLFQFSPIGELGYKNRNLYEVSDNIFTNKTNELINKIDQSNLVVEAKSNSFRKLNYLLINSDGKVWQPCYSLEEKYFQEFDKNPNRIIIGTIYDDDILEKIERYLNDVNLIFNSTGGENECFSYRGTL